jgi:single-strand DNA-binding protein
MKSLNKTILIGRLGKDPEERTFPDGGKIVNASLATSISWKDKNSGEWMEKTQWHNMIIKNAYIIEKVMQLKKGDLVYAEGDLEYRKYTGQDGIEKTITEIVIYPIRGIFDAIGKPDSLDTQSSTEKPVKQNTKKNYDDLNDDLPF